MLLELRIQGCVREGVKPAFAYDGDVAVLGLHRVTEVCRGDSGGSRSAISMFVTVSVLF